MRPGERMAAGVTAPSRRRRAGSLSRRRRVADPYAARNAPARRCRDRLLGASTDARAERVFRGRDRLVSTQVLAPTLPGRS